MQFQPDIRMRNGQLLSITKKDGAVVAIVKSIQTGESGMSSLNFDFTVSISSVNVSKSRVTLSSLYSNDDRNNGWIHVSLANSNTLRVRGGRGNGTSSASPYAQWTVTEFY